MRVAMRSMGCVVLVFACVADGPANGAEAGQTAADLRREPATAELSAGTTAANSNSAPATVPRLAASTATGRKARMTRETNLPATAPAAPAAESRKPWLVIAAVVAVMAGSHLLKRLVGRSPPAQ